MPGYLTVNVEGRGLLAKEINSINIPGRDGDYILESKYPPREIKVYYYITADSHPEWLERMQKLNQVLQTNEDVEFYFQDENCKRYGRVIKTMDPPYDSHRGIGYFIIYCQDPWAYKSIKSFNGEIITSNQYPVKIEEISFTVSNSTNLVKIINSTTGKKIILSGDFKSGDKVRITFDEIKVNERNRMNWLDPMVSDYHSFELYSGDKLIVNNAKELVVNYREKLI